MAMYSNYMQGQQPNMASMYPQQNTTPTQQPQNGLIWVQGESAARSWPVLPGTTTVLWDIDSSVIYLKSADISGMPSLKILDYTIRGTEGKTENYVTKSDFESLKHDIEEIKSRLKGNRKNQNGGNKDE